MSKRNPGPIVCVWRKGGPISIGAATAVLVFLIPACAKAMDYGSLEQLFNEPVTTSSTGTPQRASEVSADMTIITADQIRKSGSRTIPEILGMYIPGLNVLQEGVDAFDLGIRGYQQSYQPRLLVLVDGRQVFNDDYSRMSWDNMAVNIDDIRQIEVVKGAASALFGSNASGGVINIVTNSPTTDHDNSVSLSAGSQGQFHGDGTATIDLHGWGGIKLSIGGLSTREFKTARTAGDLTIGAVSPSHRYAAESSEIILNSNLSLLTEATYSEKSNQEAVFISAIDPVKAASYSVRGGLVWQSPFGIIKSDTYLNHNITRLDAGVRGTIEVDNQVIVSQLEDVFKTGADHTFRVFAEYRNKRQNDQGMPTQIFQRPEFDSNVFIAGGTWLWQMGESWSWTNSVRMDRTVMGLGGVLGPVAVYSFQDYARSYDTLAANSGLIHKMTDNDTFRIIYGRGISDPSLVESSFADAISTGPSSVLDYQGNPFLKPTIVENYSLVYERAVSAISSIVKFALYHETNSDVAAFVNGTPVLSGGLMVIPKIAQNIGGSAGSGGEIELNGSLDPFHWNASYSYQTIHDTPVVAQKLDYAGSAPHSQFRVNLGYADDKWAADLHAQYAGSTDMLRLITALQPVYAGANFNLGARIGYNISNNIIVALSGTHLTRATTLESAYPAVERQYLLNVTTRF